MKSAKSNLEKSPLIKNLPLSERPRERVLQTGAKALSLRELIAVILGQGYSGESVLGIADRFINMFSGTIDHVEQDPEQKFFESIQNTTTPAASIKCKGIGEAGKTRLLCTLEIAKRFSLYQQETSHPVTIKSTNVFPLKKIPASLRHQHHEWIGYLPVYSDGKSGEFQLVANGEQHSVSFKPRTLFTPLLNTQARAIFLAHNHPSGNLSASSDDILLTTQIEFLCQQFGIQFLGHWIVNKHRCEKV